MSITLDQVFIPACQQMLTSAEKLIEKAQIHEKEMELVENSLLDARLSTDMWPLANQIQSLWAHSTYAVEQVKTGVFKPNAQNIPSNWEEMRSILAQAQSSLKNLAEGELDAIAENNVAFVIGEKTLFEYTAQGFLLSFSLPNVYFHTTTAYDILRSRGVDLGKFDFLGKMQTKPVNL